MQKYKKKLPDYYTESEKDKIIDALLEVYEISRLVLAEQKNIPETMARDYILGLPESQRIILEVMKNPKNGSRKLTNKTFPEIMKDVAEATKIDRTCVRKISETEN